MLLQKKLFGVNSEILLGALLITAILLFYLTRQPLFAMAGFALIVLLFFLDAAPQKWDAASVKGSAAELLIALGLALAVWFGLQLALGTSSPLDVVTSCSMLPALERGDLIVVRNDAIDAPTARVAGSIEQVLKEISASDVQKQACSLSVQGRTQPADCTTGITLRGATYPFNSSNSVIVFEPTPRFYGLIVHRAFLRVSNGTHEYFFTKGDNNLGLDQEAGISLVSRSDVHGRVIARIPFVGFLKLFLFLQFEEPQGCKLLVTGGN